MYKSRLQFEIFLFIAVVFCFIAGCDCGNRTTDVGSLSRKTKNAKNVILITVSTLRADHAGCLGYKKDTTPNLDKFGSENILFTNAFAASSWAMPAHGSILTSLYPGVHGATHIDKKLAPEHRTLAEILADNGYCTVGFCCNPQLSSELGFAQGFELYDDYSVSMMLQSMAFESQELIDINKKRTNDLINDAAIRWLQNNTHKPFFMLLHYYDNHWDYLPPAPYDKLYDPNYDGPIDGTNIAREPLFSNVPGQRDIEHIVSLYDGEIRQSDNDLGEMLAVLKEKGLFENSIIIIIGDHGEQFYEHGHTSHHGIYDELIHVPLAISIPAAKTRGQRINSLVSQVDILPTILDYLGIPIPEKCRGKSLMPVIDGRVEKVNDFVFAEYTGGAVPDCLTVMAQRYKYVEQGGESFVYDIIEDPSEQNKIFQDDFTNEITEQVKIFRQFLCQKEK